MAIPSCWEYILELNVNCTPLVNKFQSLRFFLLILGIPSLYSVSTSRMTSRQFGKKIKEHIPIIIDEFCKTCNKENKSIRIVNASKRSAIAEHLVNNLVSASNYNLKGLK